MKKTVPQTVLTSAYKSMISHLISPISTVNPRHAESFKDDHDNQRQCCGIIVKHGHKIVATSLSEEQANEEAQDTATHCMLYNDKTKLCDS